MVLFNVMVNAHLAVLSTAWVSLLKSCISQSRMKYKSGIKKGVAEK